MIDNLKIRKSINEVINRPCFDIIFYTNERIEELFVLTQSLLEKLELEQKSKIEIVNITNKYIQENILLEMQYFDNFIQQKEENLVLIFRTAYSALKFKKTTCYGYSELVCILLTIFDIDPHVLLVKFPKEKYKMVHYTTVVEIGKEVLVVDPEREIYCQKKNLSFNEYLEDCIFIKPPYEWKEKKLDNFGVGTLVNDILKEEKVTRIKGTRELKKIIHL